MLFFGDIYILIFVVVVLQLTNHPMCKELPLSPEKCASRNVSQGGEAREFGVSGPHLSHRARGSLRGLERGLEASIPRRALPPAGRDGPEGPQVTEAPLALALLGALDRMQARSHPFRKSPHASQIAAA